MFFHLKNPFFSSGGIEILITNHLLRVCLGGGIRREKGLFFFSKLSQLQNIGREVRFRTLSNVGVSFTQFITMLEVEFSTKLKTVQIDGGGEFKTLAPLFTAINVKSIDGKIYISKNVIFNVIIFLYLLLFPTNHPPPTIVPKSMLVPIPTPSLEPSTSFFFFCHFFHGNFTYYQQCFLGSRQVNLSTTLNTVTYDFLASPVPNSPRSPFVNNSLIPYSPSLNTPSLNSSHSTPLQICPNLLLGRINTTLFVFLVNKS